MINNMYLHVTFSRYTLASVPRSVLLFVCHVDLFPWKNDLVWQVLAGDHVVCQLTVSMVTENHKTKVSIVFFSGYNSFMS